MHGEQFSDLRVGEIMSRWPATIGIFIDYGLHCIGCPIGVFHTLIAAAREHGIPPAVLEGEVAAAVRAATTAGPGRARRRSAPAGAGHVSAASAGRLRPVRRPPRR
ncbi:MAG TPA: DUF1858 domain-containing protein [Alphaproteobacteria bacterium]|nr:DUF1858 domain-containing protein [Alphaproteobacteria bacterium]